MLCRILASAAAALLLVGCARSERELPNVLIVVIDTMRADRLPFYGCPQDTAPFLTEVAAGGAVFENAFSTSSFTPPATASLFTGLYPFQHRVEAGGRKGNEKDFVVHRIPDEIETLPELLRARGYRTFGIVDNPMVGRDAGFARGFDMFGHFAYEGAAAVNGTLENWLPRIRGVGDESAGPWLVYLHYMDVHQPYAPRGETKVPIDRRDLPIPPAADMPAAHRDRLLEVLEYDGTGNSTRFLVERLLANFRAYNNQVRFLDGQIERMFELLGVGDDTLVVITADHGEEFGDHGDVAHKFQLYPELVRIPLVLRWKAGGVAASRIAAPASLIDLLPTLRDAVGAPPDRLHGGVSLLPFARGASLPNRLLLTMRAQDLEQDGGAASRVEIRGALRWPAYLITNSAGAPPELYDLEDDPRAWSDCRAENIELVRALEADANELIAGSTTFEPSRFVSAEADPAHFERLRELGYLGGR